MVCASPVPAKWVPGPVRNGKEERRVTGTRAGGERGSKGSGGATCTPRVLASPCPGGSEGQVISSNDLTWWLARPKAAPSERALSANVLTDKEIERLPAGSQVWWHGTAGPLSWCSLCPHPHPLPLLFVGNILRSIYWSYLSSPRERCSTENKTSRGWVNTWTVQATNPSLSPVSLHLLCLRIDHSWQEKNLSNTLIKHFIDGEKCQRGSCFNQNLPVMLQQQRRENLCFSPVALWASQCVCSCKHVERPGMLLGARNKLKAEHTSNHYLQEGQLLLPLFWCLLLLPTTCSHKSGCFAFSVSCLSQLWAVWSEGLSICKSYWLLLLINPINHKAQICFSCCGAALIPLVWNISCITCNMQR